MKRKYKISEILHSGRKGLRNTPNTDNKYDGLLGCTVSLDVADLRPYHGIYMDVYDSRIYDYWETSVIIEAMQYRDSGNLILETANTIYKLEAITDE